MWNSSALLELPWEALSCVEDLARREGRVLSFSISLFLIGFGSFFVMGAGLQRKNLCLLADGKEFAGD